jgi:hypothetical protein
MHYKNGREVKLGDQVVGKDCAGNIQSGTVIKATAGSDTCNLVIVPPGTPALYATAKECLHVDDAMNVPMPDQAPAKDSQASA